MKVRLYALAHGRSGDKGDSVNIGVITRREEWYEFLRENLTADAVASFLQPIAEGPVKRYELPNLGALNYVVEHALGGGGSTSLQLDAQGKTYAQALLRMPIHVPDALGVEIHTHWGDDLPQECLVPE